MSDWLGLQLALHAPRCPVHYYLHLLCPGCGMTRAVLALLRGDVGSAWRLNPLALLLLPGLLVYTGVAAWRRQRGWREPWPPLPAPAVRVLLLLTAGFTLWRNL